MPDRMVTLRLDPSSATLSSVKERYRLRQQDVDEQFGVVCVSPEQNLFAILVSEEAATRLEGSEGVGGAFSNPTIETFGPPR